MYYEPNMLRSNLVVLASAHVTSIALMKDAGGIIIATGVKFVHHEKAYQTFVAKEVVLSAGCVRKSRTPRNTDTDSSPQGHHVSSGTFNKLTFFVSIKHYPDSRAIRDWRQRYSSKSRYRSPLGPSRRWK